MEIKYRAGHQNVNANALSRFPLPTTPPTSNTGIVVVTTNCLTDRPGGRPSKTPIVEAQGGEASLGEKQRTDPELRKILDYLVNGDLPSEVIRLEN